MYGYLKLDGPHGRSSFAAAQCGLCATYGSDFRTRTRLLAGPDPTLLLMLLEALAPAAAPRDRTRCPLTAMLRHRAALAHWAPLPLVAALQVIIASEKLLDDRHDKDGLVPALAARLMRADIARAEARLLAADLPLDPLRALLRTQAALEADPTADLDRLAAPTAHALGLIGRALGPVAGLRPDATAALRTLAAHPRNHPPDPVFRSPVARPRRLFHLLHRAPHRAGRHRLRRRGQGRRR